MIIASDLLYFSSFSFPDRVDDGDEGGWTQYNPPAPRLADQQAGPLHGAESQRASQLQGGGGVDGGGDGA